MINKISKIKILIIFSVFLIFGCSQNRFKNAGQINSFTFGLFGYDDTDCRKKYDPTWMQSYSNGKYPSRICTRYQYYTCHITHYCPNLATELERKKCEQDANDYWLLGWDNAKGDPVKKIEITKKVCESESSKNSQL